ncbi:MAG TPA: DUF4257 domain-containing protein [Oculatellaceae cyanobacterium]
MILLKTVKRRHFLAFFLMGTILNPSLVYAIDNKVSSNQSLTEPPYWLVLTITGVIGGLCYTLQDGELELPTITKNHVKLGFLADCIIGVVGAFVLYPVALNFFKEVPIPSFALNIVTGFIGGYGGRTIINNVLDKLLISKVNEIKNKVEEKQEELKQKVIQAEEKQEELKQKVIQSEEKRGQLEEDIIEQDKNDVRAIELVVDRQFDLDFISSDDEFYRLRKAIKEASPKAKVSIFLQAKQTRIHTFNNGELLRMERTIPVFDALLRCTEEHNLRHRYHAQLAYIYKDKEKPSWTEAIAHLTRAIEEREKEIQQWTEASEQHKKELDASDTFWFYEFNLAICLIHRDNDFNHGQHSQKDCRDAVLHNLREASRKIAEETGDKIDMVDLLNPTVNHDEYDPSQNLFLVSLKLNDKTKELIKAWLDRNDLQLTDLRTFDRASDQQCNLTHH